jgi:antitoxin component YwqK of YwqJK toxin-antitoxin module
MFSQTNSKHVYVKPHVRANGTYVEGHYRTAPNSTNRDNFSTRGNTNPYTGQPGWVEPDNKPSTTYQSPPSIYSTPPSYSSPVLKNENQNERYLGTTNSSGQKVITYRNGREIFGLCKTCQDVIYKDDVDYYWYSPYSGVQTTKGGNGGTLLDGEYQFFNENGELISKATYKKGVENGEFIRWDEEGNIIDKMLLSDGKPTYMKFKNDDGYWIEWKGELFKKGSVKNVYTKSNFLVETSFYVRDFMARYKIYNEYSGKLEREFTKSLSEYYDGPYKSYYSSGIPRVIGLFDDNFQVGVWKYFTEDSVMTAVRYRVYEERYPSGKLKVKGGQYFSSLSSEWIKDGMWIYFKPNGEDWLDYKEFEDGEEVNQPEPKSNDQKSNSTNEMIVPQQSKSGLKVTEQIIPGDGVVVIKRTITTDSKVIVYEKKIFNWGGISCFKDGFAITELDFNRETE